MTKTETELNKMAARLYRGVRYRNGFNKFRATIRTPDGERKHLGYFDSAHAAALAHDAAAVEMYGPGAIRNFACHLCHGVLPPE